MPILAVSGLDHDIKIISEKATDLDGLSEVGVSLITMTTTPVMVSCLCLGDRR